MWQKYDISSLGFLPEKCLDKLPLSYQHLTPLLDNLSSKDVHQFRSLVKALPEYTLDQYPTSSLSLEEKRFIYSVLTMIIQKYLWADGSEKPLGIIPTELGAPLLTISKELGLPPVLTYSGVILYNWSVKDPSQPVDLDNLKVNYKLTEGEDYEWFCIVHTAIEAEGGKVMKQVLDLHQEMKNQNNEAIKATLKQVTEVIVNTHQIMKRMYDHCSPQDFWNFRFYFEGTNCPKAFPNGLHVKGFEDQNIKFRGASGGQSTLIQIFDAVFSVDHVGHGADFLEEMRDYMPGAHRDFIEDFLKLPPLKDYISESGDEELISLYLEGVNKFTDYRNFHFQLVHDYIFQMLKMERKEIEPEHEEKEKDLYKNSETGTGGTDPRVFLQNLIWNTRKVKSIFRRGNDVIKEETKQQQKYQFKIKFDQRKMEDFLISLVVAVAGSLIIKSVL